MFKTMGIALGFLTAFFVVPVYDILDYNNSGDPLTTVTHGDIVPKRFKVLTVDVMYLQANCEVWTAEYLSK